MEEKKDAAATEAVEQPVVDTEVGKQKIKKRPKVLEISCPKFMPENGQLYALMNDYRRSKVKMKCILVIRVGKC